MYFNVKYTSPEREKIQVIRVWNRRKRKACFTAVRRRSQDLFTAAGRISVIGEHVDYCGASVSRRSIGATSMEEKTDKTSSASRQAISKRW
ncbi:MAG: galactokinase family protein [Christensenellaceae bacterium]